MENLFLCLFFSSVFFFENVPLSLSISTPFIMAPFAIVGRDRSPGRSSKWFGWVRKTRYRGWFHSDEAGVFC